MNGTRQVALRIVNAEESFISYVQEQIGCTRDEATKVLFVYRKQRLIKIDPVMGSWHIKHGAFLEPTVLRNAVNF